MVLKIVMLSLAVELAIPVLYAMESNGQDEWKKNTCVELVAHLKKYPNLEKLHIEWNHVHEGFEEALFDSVLLEQLEKLEFEFTGITSHLLATFLKKCPNLKRLSMDATAFLDEGFDEAVFDSLQLTKLNDLNFAYVIDFTGTQLIAFLKRCPNLRRLSLNWCPYVHEELDALVFNSLKLDKLETFFLKDTWFTDDQIDLFKKVCPGAVIETIGPNAVVEGKYDVRW